MAGVLSSACTSARLLPACDTCSDLGWAVASPCHCGVRAAAGRRCFRVTPRARELPRSSASRPGPGRVPLKPGFTCVGTSGDAEYGNLSPEESSPSPRKLAEEALPREQLGMCSPSRSSVGVASREEAGFRLLSCWRPWPHSYCIWVPVQQKQASSVRAGRACARLLRTTEGAAGGHLLVGDMGLARGSLVNHTPFPRNPTGASSSRHCQQIPDSVARHVAREPLWQSG